MAYLFLILLALLTPMAAYFVSDQMIYRFHYHPLAHSNQRFWKRDMSDEDLDRLAISIRENLPCLRASSSALSASRVLVISAISG